MFIVGCHCLLLKSPYLFLYIWFPISKLLMDIRQWEKGNAGGIICGGRKYFLWGAVALEFSCNSFIEDWIYYPLIPYFYSYYSIFCFVVCMVPSEVDFYKWYEMFRQLRSLLLWLFWTTHVWLDAMTFRYCLVFREFCLLCFQSLDQLDFSVLLE